MAPTEQIQEKQVNNFGNLIPKPVSVQLNDGFFTLTAATKIVAQSGSSELMTIGQYLAAKINPSTGFNIRVAQADAPSHGNIFLTTNGGDPSLGEEGYVLTVSGDSVLLTAYRPAGIFRGIQTIRQLLPPSIESSGVQAGPWTLPAGVVRDYPRFAWRGVMLDVARHFFSVQDVKRYIDLLAYYKINRFHLHLSDDQGWRIAISRWPNLALYGGSTQVGGGPGGYYTQADYTEIVSYAADRYIIVIPEIDMPGHTNAALASYADLNKDGVARPLYTGTNVGFSTLATGKELTYIFLDNVIGELAELTPGPYIHIGGDEAKSTDSLEYIRFIDRVQSIVQSHNKQMVGWEEIAHAHLNTSAIAQYWTNSKFAMMAQDKGLKVIMSPAPKMYMDMKYNSSTVLGFDWAGTIEVKDAYSWDPATEVTGLSEQNILGVEAPLWSETLLRISDIEFMAFPRVLGYAEIGWSPAASRSWDEYSVRLGIQGQRLTNMNVNFYRSAQVPWNNK